VANPERVDGLASRVLGLVLAGPVDAEDARLVLAQVPEFGDAAHLIVRRLAAEARWEEFDAIVQLAGAAALVDVGPVLCDVLESDARPPRPGHIVDVLGQLRYDDAVELLERLLGRFVYAEVDLSNARRCLRALSVMGTDRSRAKLHIISWYDWPAPIPQWAAEELLVDTGVVLGEVGDDGRWTPGWRIPGWDPDGGGSS
jgi:hypothetical protein